MNGRGFTLIELLISMTIGMIIVASTWTAFSQIRATTVRSKASAAINADAAVVHLTLENAFSACFHGSQFRLQVSEKGDADKAALTFDLMTSQRQRFHDMGRVVPYHDYRNDLVWTRFRFVVKNGDGRPALYRAVSSSSWTLNARTPYKRITGIQMVADPDDAGHSVPAWVDEDIVLGGSTNTSASIMVGPDVRRDRRRSMLDNDTRLIRNIPGAVHAAFTTDASGARVVASDDENLDSSLQLVSDRISHLRIDIVDYLGNVTHGGVDPVTGAPTGIAYADRTGAPITPVPPDPAVAGAPDVWSSTLRVVDGIWSDGRADPCPYNPGAITLPNPARERPALVRISFRMHDRTSGIWREFGFSFPTSPVSVRGFKP